MYCINPAYTASARRQAFVRSLPCNCLRTACGPRVKLSIAVDCPRSRRDGEIALGGCAVLSTSLERRDCRRRDSPVFTNLERNEHMSDGLKSLAVSAQFSFQRHVLPRISTKDHTSFSLESTRTEACFKSAWNTLLWRQSLIVLALILICMWCRPPY